MCAEELGNTVYSKLWLLSCNGKECFVGVSLVGRLILDWILRVLGHVAAHRIGLAYQASVVAVTDLQVL
jgi:hypothetical protein